MLSIALLVGSESWATLIDMPSQVSYVVSRYS